ncbi:MscS Mechanosensitive ion channel OS=Tsukamurella paurometabola (strain ATCC 8368 / DSM / CCUG 35730 / CIP 100753 / JCM 10117 / KCTC 9821 / NBRC 16120 /NCIMB 702349 / NCTC 13040) OX=521096 GN=Tpau_3024 PE=3 SV=1 [Tsukamurella paurometabola]|uniref:MscS Mechanosensitive ion channel n=1 Tax=Tsukamurella paurometabola (strain ATCC 8368 / DSM 20162 / CCUG 35730 / CIP 100753 / JCM 10117 / KCTC 9821 / NBRC 16120 / NCIMB 702349 / NCTC 13040) TaxID=521096 RepID=D5UUB5_TSUPD|nr:mechanosensitive ion channel family protein [Tsukamurella paurometabola]ADG79618.1 MscS Mechanosensitive ion channel [Tsukamurella paurometabola DSM 20162]SUP36468.1 Small-conductance mechanosensitive channel [Tsukamurella paurometabola]
MTTETLELAITFPDSTGWRLLMFERVLPIALWSIAAVLANRFVNWASARVTMRIDAEFKNSDSLVRSESAKHQHAVIQVISWVAIAAIYLLAGYQIIVALGVPITALVAPATVIGAALGFGAQRVVQDLLAGFFLITERQYGFGDVVNLALTGGSTAEGTVEDVTLRVTKLRNTDGEVITVPNGQVVKATNLSKDWARAVVDIPLPTTVDLGKVNALLHTVGERAFQDPYMSTLLLDEPSVMGVESIDLDQVNMRMVARTLPGKQFEVGRNLRERIVRSLATAGISVEPLTDTVDPRTETPQGGEKAAT